jgi:hypothetical protein
METYKKYLIEKPQEERNLGKQQVKKWFKKFKGNEKKIRELITNLVNSPYEHVSNDFVTGMWNEYNKVFAS